MKCLSKFHAIGAGIETRIMTCGGPTTHEEFTFVIKIRDFKHGSNMITKQCTNVLYCIVYVDFCCRSSSSIDLSITNVDHTPVISCCQL